MQFIDVMKQKELILVLTKKEIIGRYRGSSLGMLWSLLVPVTMLIVYTFVFSIVFNAKWPGSAESKADFALLLFAGLIVFNFMAECINRSPHIIFENINYVKKVVFPLPILPVVILLSSLFHLLVSIVVWVVFYILVHNSINWTIILLPLYLFPLIIMILGTSYLISSVSVYFRDLAQIVGVVVTLVMFLSPIFYPIESVPDDLRGLLLINPLAPSIEYTRKLLYWGEIPSIGGFLLYSLLSILVLSFGFIIFNKLKKGFSDVL